MNKEKIMKILNTAKLVAMWIVVAIAVFMMIFTLISNRFNRTDKSLFGFKFFIVQTDSMSATDFDAGDMIISKAIDVRELKEGDIITFVSQSSHNYGETVTHKIRRVTEDADGSIAFVTYGTTTDTDDEALATVIIGKYVGKIPNLGIFFAFLKSTPGYILCILVPFMILILTQGLNCIRLFRRYKKEQTDAMNEEREKLEKERAEAQKMMEELMALKKELAAKETTDGTSGDTDEG